MGSIDVEERGAGAFVLWIDNQPRRNAIDSEMLAKLIALLESLAGRHGLRSLAIRGRGGNFCSGRSLAEATGSDGSPDYRAMHTPLRTLAKRLISFPAPTIAVIEGYALGFGLSLATWCDLTLAASDAQLGVPEVHHGVAPTATIVSLLRHVSRPVAVDLALTGRRITGREAAAAGLVRYVVDASAIDVELARLQDELARGSPLALRLSKQVFSDARRADETFLESLDLAIDASVAVGTTDDAREGFRAFREKRPARWPSRSA